MNILNVKIADMKIGERAGRDFGDGDGKMRGERGQQL